MDYDALKGSHMGLAYLSILLFIIRFSLFKFQPSLRSNKLLKILPHIIDTVLIIFAIMLCIEISQYPLTDHWLTAKVLGLVAYIGFGVVAINSAIRSRHAAAERSKILVAEPSKDIGTLQ